MKQPLSLVLQAETVTQAETERMKTFVILSLAVFTGCTVTPIHAEEPNPHLEYLKDLFWSYVAHATHPTNETAEVTGETQYGQEASAGLTQSTDQHAFTLKNQMDSLAVEWMTNFAKEAKVLKEVLEQDLKTLKGQMESYADNVKFQIQQRVEELRAAMAPYADALKEISKKK